MSDLIQVVKGTALSVAEYFTPVLKQSKFKKTGVLTPEEFVIAGDHLVHQCPTWSWCEVKDSTLRKPYLPADKQYLVTKSVPCYKRCKDIEYCDNEEKIILAENGDEGWVDTHHSAEEQTVGDIAINDEEVKPMFAEPEPVATGSQQAEEGMEDDEAEDMDKFMNMVEDEDTSVAPVITKFSSNVSQPNFDNNLIKSDADADNNQDNILTTRTYDLNITYDKFYQTPRLWLVGYDEHLKPLSINEMYEDISQDHVRKTVTMETHPHIPAVMASVHPCRHAEVMKKIISTVEDGGRELQVFSYLIIFLKLVQSVIPTLEYDFTQNFTM